MNKKSLIRDLGYQAYLDGHDVDDRRGGLEVSGLRVQALVRHRVAEYLQVPNGADCLVVHQESGPRLVVMEWEDFLAVVPPIECLGKLLRQQERC